MLTQLKFEIKYVLTTKQRQDKQIQSIQLHEITPFSRQYKLSGLAWRTYIWLTSGLLEYPPKNMTGRKP